MIPFLLSALLEFQDAEALVERFRASKGEAREEASRALKELGTPGVAALERAARPDAADRDSLRRLIRSIQIRERLSPALLKALPGIEDRLSESPTEADTPWTSIFLDEVVPALLTKTIEPKDVEAIAGLAIHAAATPKEKNDVCQAVLRCSLRAHAGNLLRFLDDPHAGVRETASKALCKLAGPELVSALAERAGSEGGEASVSAICILFHIPAPDLIPELVKALNDPRPVARRGAAQFLGQWEKSFQKDPAQIERSVVPELRRLLADEDEATADAAAGALRKFARTTPIASMEKLLDHDQPRVRLRAASVILEDLRGVSNTFSDAQQAALVRVARLAENGTPKTRREAEVLLLTVSRLRDGWDFVPLLQSKEAGVRAWAAETLGRASSPDRIPDLQRLLDDPDENVKARVKEAINRLRQK